MAAVVVEEISKRYRLGSGGGYRRLTETVTDVVRRQKRQPSEADDLWALKDVSFEVQEGEVIGVIGRNGAGKSTLLKILSRITEPTSGRAVLRGRLGSLLEVGTGFHPELSGRDNIFLNGAVLGMRKGEIVRRFDEIVEFAEVERFLDTPVKRYSSGMYVRLAFAVAAHLEPEILVVDEVLAVGDAEFQKKCLGKMGDVARSGRTVLFVSHNMAAVRRLCSRGVLLDHGAVHTIGSIDDVLAAYLESEGEIVRTDLSQRTDRTGGERFRFVSVRLEVDGHPAPALLSGKIGSIVLEYVAPELSGPVRASIALVSSDGEQFLHLDSELTGAALEVRERGSWRCTLDSTPLVPGAYSVTVFAEGATGVLDWIVGAARLDVLEGDFYGTGRAPLPGYGPVLAAHRWSAAG